MSYPETFPFPAKILVVDDRPENHVVLDAVFKDSPEYCLVTASSGLEAIERVKETEFALILLDIQMPGLDGYETAKRIKALDHGKNVPIMLISAIYREDPHVLKGFSVGAIDYVCKPFDPDILKAKVNVYASLYVKSRQLRLQNEYLLQLEKQFGGRRKMPRYPPDLTSDGTPLRQGDRYPDI